MTLVAQISDLHIKAPGKLAYRVVDTAPYLARAVEALNALTPQPDLVVASGDLTDAGSPAEYAHLRTLLAPLRAPVYLVMGNHDERDALRAAFPEKAELGTSGPVQYALEVGEMRIVVADSSNPGESGGAFDQARLRWLAATLDASRAPTVLFVHHPPFATGFAAMDEDGLRDDDGAFAALVAARPHVRRLACGHLHRTTFARWAGTAASSCPSTAHQLYFDLAPQAAAQFVLEPPGFSLHRYANGEVVTHLCSIERSGGPYPFREGGKLIP